MKYIWTITVKTSLPNICCNRGDLVTTCEAYNSFDVAKARLREILKELAFSENAMFDGKGFLKMFSKYIKDEEDAVKDDDWFKEWIPDTVTWSDGMTLFFLKELHAALYRIFSGIEEKLCFPNQEYEDNFLWANVFNGCIHLEGFGEGPYNGTDPHIKTNMFDMSEEKDYMLYIDDYFCDQDHSSQLYIDLKKTPFFEQQDKCERNYRYGTD